MPYSNRFMYGNDFGYGLGYDLGYDFGCDYVQRESYMFHVRCRVRGLRTHSDGNVSDMSWL
jgi:hypothetical protein